MTLLKKLTEGIVDRDLSKEGVALRAKWESTGLLEGLGSETQKNRMAVLLENQAKQLLKEATSMAAGDVEGFAAVAFPIVRRVFGSLIANDLVSVQPMSLPSGLIFFLDISLAVVLLLLLLRRRRQRWHQTRFFDVSVSFSPSFPRHSSAFRCLLHQHSWPQ